jgi:hypothetical protein
MTTSEHMLTLVSESVATEAPNADGAIRVRDMPGHYCSLTQLKIPGYLLLFPIRLSDGRDVYVYMKVPSF